MILSDPIVFSFFQNTGLCWISNIFYFHCHWFLKLEKEKTEKSNQKSYKTNIIELSAFVQWFIHMCNLLLCYADSNWYIRLYIILLQFG